MVKTPETTPAPDLEMIMENNFDRGCTIKLRDMQLEAEPSALERQRRRSKNSCPQLYEQRVGAHRMRIEAEEKFMREHGIDPHRAGSALKFDKLVGAMAK